MLWRGLTLLKTTHNHRHGSQGASQGNQQSDGHGGARVVRVMSGWHRCIVPTTGRFNGPTRRRLLEWLKAAQCEGCGGETRSFLLFE